MLAMTALFGPFTRAVDQCNTNYDKQRRQRQMMHAEYLVIERAGTVLQWQRVRVSRARDSCEEE